MSRLNVPFEPVDPQTRELLEERARRLAAGALVQAGPQAEALLCVVFELGGARCALEAALVQRALVRLGQVAAVPLSESASRPVAFVDGRALPVADLAAHVRGRARGAEALSRSPALVVGPRLAPVALAVDGPLELSAQRLAQSVQAGTEEWDEGPRLSGRLVDGTLLLSAQWLLGWAESLARPG